jgi:hypothetical protein
LNGFEVDSGVEAAVVSGLNATGEVAWEMIISAVLEGGLVLEILQVGFSGEIGSFETFDGWVEKSVDLVGHVGTAV